MFEINYNSLKKINKATYKIIIIGIVTIILFSLVPGYYIIKKMFLNGKTDGVLTKYETYDDTDKYYQHSYKGTYSFTVDEKEYTCKDSFSLSNVPSQNRIILYNSNNPKYCQVGNINIPSFFAGFLFPISIGIIMIVLGIIGLAKNKRTINKAKYLSKNGKLIKNVPFRLEKTNHKNKGVQLYIVNIEIPNKKKKLKHYKSEPKQVNTEKEFVDLLIDPNNDKNYYIDFDIKYNGNVKVEEYNGHI